jgi:D-alanyl-D-alanine dipeptidase
MKHPKVFLISLSAVIIALTGTFVFAQVKKPVPPVKPERADPKIRLSEARQAILVITANDSAVKGQARFFERDNESSDWKPRGEKFPIVVGAKGLAWAEDMASLLENKPALYKKEGDGKSPAGVFNLTEAFGVSSKPEMIEMPYTKLGKWSECVDDSKSFHYNRLVDRMKVGNFDWKSSEKMLEIGEQYELGVFVAHNSYPVVKGNGSCIFLHIWKNDSTGTAGCTAMERKNVESILTYLNPEKNPIVVQLTEADHKKYRKTWMLPKKI